MATFNRFDQFSEDLAEKVHDLNADTLEWYLSNATPSASNSAVFKDPSDNLSGRWSGCPVRTSHRQNTLVSSNVHSSPSRTANS